jgi:hypothetical protein
MFSERTNYTELNQMAEEAKKRAEIARYTSMLPHYLYKERKNIDL